MSDKTQIIFKRKRDDEDMNNYNEPSTPDRFERRRVKVLKKYIMMDDMFQLERALEKWTVS
jgi:hypothetical protein